MSTMQMPLPDLFTATARAADAHRRRKAERAAALAARRTGHDRRGAAARRAVRNARHYA